MSSTTVDLRQFWATRSLDFIQPNRGGEFSEGFDPRPILRVLMPGSVVDVGCGYGRLCEAFDDYIGVDISPLSLGEARRRHPDKDFREYTTPLPASDWQLYYAVLLHVPDDELPAYLAQNTPSTRGVVVADIMGRQWRRPEREPYTWNREIEDYTALLGPCEVFRYALTSYPGESLTILKFAP